MIQIDSYTQNSIKQEKYHLSRLPECSMYAIFYLPLARIYGVHVGKYSQSHGAYGLLKLFHNLDTCHDFVDFKPTVRVASSRRPGEYQNWGEFGVCLVYFFGGPVMTSSQFRWPLDVYGEMCWSKSDTFLSKTFEFYPLKTESQEMLLWGSIDTDPHKLLAKLRFN